MTQPEYPRWREDPEVSSELRLALADFVDEFPRAEELASLRAALLDRLKQDPKAPRLRSQESGAPPSLRRALEDDASELPSALEHAQLRQSLQRRIVREELAPRPHRKRARSLVVAALWTLPAAAAALGTYRLIDRDVSPVNRAPSALAPGREPVQTPNATASSSTLPAPSASASTSSGGTPKSTFVAAPRVTRKPTPQADQRELAQPTELELVQRARGLMNSAPAEALELTRQHARLYPNGVFEQEREVIAIECLQKIGERAQAEQRAQRFAERFPGSLHLPRLARLLPAKQ